MMPPCTCASIVFGLTTMPQSTAHTTRFTSTSPLSTATSTTIEKKLPNACITETPRPCPVGSAGPPQPAAFVATSSTLSARGVLPSSARRYCTGSVLVCAASSSMKLSTTNVPRVGPTPRQNAVGTWRGSWRT